MTIETNQVTRTNINDLMVAALEGGINYWCGEVEMKKDDLGGYVGVSFHDEETLDYASEIIGMGGILIMTDVEDPTEKWELNREKFIKGLEKTIEWDNYESLEDLMENHDATTADNIIQFALFNEIVFG